MSLRNAFAGENPAHSHQRKERGMDEMKVGDYITVLNWITLQDRSYVGDTLKIIAVDWPFMRVEKDIMMNGTRKKLFEVILDLREVEIKKLSSEMIAL